MMKLRSALLLGLLPVAGCGALVTDAEYEEITGENRAASVTSPGDDGEWDGTLPRGGSGGGDDANCNDEYADLACDDNSLNPPPTVCTEAMARDPNSTCANLGGYESLRVLSMIASIKDCPQLRTLLGQAHAAGRIRALPSIPRPDSSCAVPPFLRHCEAVATTDLSTGIIVLARSHWMASGDNLFVAALRHEGGHLLFPNGGTFRGTQLDTEGMAQSHGTCFQ